MSFYTISGIIARAVHTAVSLYAVAVVMCALIKVDGGSIFASTGMMGDSPMGYLSIWWALLILGAIALGYTIAGGFLAVLMTDVIQFGVLLAVVVFMIPLSFNAVGGVSCLLIRPVRYRDSSRAHLRPIHGGGFYCGYFSMFL